MLFAKRQSNLDGRKVGDEMDGEKVISTLEEIETQTAEIGLDSAVIAHEFIDKIIALLKEQEPIAPRLEKDTQSGWTLKYCGNCGKQFWRPDAKYCEVCGRPVK